MFQNSTEIEVVDDSRAAEILGLGIQTLRNLRYMRKGPAYVKMGRSVRYRVIDLLDYIEKHLVDPGKPNE
jgi:hypothetical protein